MRKSESLSFVALYDTMGTKRGVIAMNTDKQIRIAIRMKEDEKKEFMDLCKEKCINSSELIRFLIRKWINENKNT